MIKSLKECSKFMIHALVFKSCYSDVVYFDLYNIRPEALNLSLLRKFSVILIKHVKLLGKFNPAIKRTANAFTLYSQRSL